MESASNSSLESAEARANRLQRRRERERNRRASETAEQREERLRKRRIRDRGKRATEPKDQREVRLERMRTSQSERLATETEEQREARRQCDRERHREQQQPSQLPLLEQPSVQAKMRRFHSHFSTLDVPTCTTSSKGFPGLKLHSRSTECLPCSQDKHTPKLYSVDNNMNPGPVPPQLQVNT